MLKKRDLMGSNVSIPFFVCIVMLTKVFLEYIVHGANGYLVTQFLDTTCNYRTDEWGGSKENRSRFGLEVLKVLKEVFGNNVAVKLSPAGGYNDVGYDSYVSLSY